LVEKQPVRTWCSIYVFNHSVLARGNAGLPASLYNNSLMYVCVCVCVSVRIFARSVPIGREPTNRDAEFFGAVKRRLPIGREAGPSYWSGERSVPIGREPTNHGRGVLLSCQTERFDWTGERSVLIGREPTNRDAEFFGAVKRRLLIGQEAGPSYWLGGTKRSDRSGTDQSQTRSSSELSNGVF
jgi:hypothetical protein